MLNLHKESKEVMTEYEQLRTENELKAEDRHLRNLLAVVHSDGGHHAANYGLRSPLMKLWWSFCGSVGRWRKRHLPVNVRHLIGSILKYCASNLAMSASGVVDVLL